MKATACIKQERGRWSHSHGVSFEAGRGRVSVTARKSPRFGLPRSWAPDSLLLIPSGVQTRRFSFSTLQSSLKQEWGWSSLKKFLNEKELEMGEFFLMPSPVLCTQ